MCRICRRRNRTSENLRRPLAVNRFDQISKSELTLPKRMKVLTPILMTLFAGIFCGLGCGRSESETRALFDKVGGISEINKEAKTIFDIFGTNEVYGLQDFGKSMLSFYPEVMTNHPDIRDFPAIFALGKSAMLLGGATNQTALIKINFGTHWNGGSYFIFPPGFNVMSDPNWASLLNAPKFFQVTSNIIASK